VRFGPRVFDVPVREGGVLELPREAMELLALAPGDLLSLEPAETWCRPHTYRDIAPLDQESSGSSRSICPSRPRSSGMSVRTIFQRVASSSAK
jgi:hypothetical protein